MRTPLRWIGWVVVIVVVVVYGAFALQMGISELLFLLGVSPELKHRASPVIFVIHSLTGAVALIAAPLQSLKWIRQSRRLRPALGRSYVAAVWISSVTAVFDALAFDITSASKAVFVVVAIVWFATTTMGFLLARKRQFPRQHEWMIRSYSLTLFFVSFSLWVPALASTALPASISHPLALFLSGSLNLAAAELWIRRARRTSMAHTAPA